LTDKNSPFPSTQKTYPQIFYQLMKQKIIKSLLGKKRWYANICSLPQLAIIGIVLNKK